MAKMCLETTQDHKQPFPDLMEMPPSVTGFDQANIGRKWKHTSICFRLFSHHSPFTGS